jgi:hypothetical protein
LTPTSSVAAAPSTTAVPDTSPQLTWVVAGDGRLVALDSRSGEIARELFAPAAGASSRLLAARRTRVSPKSTDRRAVGLL